MSKPPDKPASAEVWPPEFLHLLEQAEQGDVTVLPALRQVLDATPQLWRDIGDLAKHAELTLVQHATGNNLLLREALDRKLQALKTELREAGDGVLHGLLIERVVLGWLELHGLEATCTHLRDQYPAPAQVEALERRRNHVHRRYLAALRSLATVRKLLLRTPSPLDVATRWQAKSAPTKQTATTPAPQRSQRPQCAGILN